MSGSLHARLWLCVVIVCASGCSAGSYVSYRIHPDYPREANESLEMPGFQAPVLVYFDSIGAPHVDAQNELDLVRAVGFLHGRTRFFQMDMMRRYASGRLAELVGDQKVLLGSTVELDATMRGWGFADTSRAEAEALDADLKALMTAYVEGVNAGLERYEPIEYRLLGVRPEPWTIEDSLSVSLLVGWGISHNWEQETCRLLLALSGGWERAEQILPPEPWPGAASMEAQGDAHALPPSVVPEIQAMFPARAARTAAAGLEPASHRVDVSLPRIEGASNGWVVGGGLTASGKPIVAGDPHLPHMLPSIVFQEHLRCPGLDVIGLTVPGIPYVMFGHNADVSWTITSAMADVIDLYIERPAPAAEAQVMGPDGPEPLTTRSVRVRVRKGSKCTDRFVRMRQTPRGTLLNDLYPGLLGEGAPLVSVRQAPAQAAGSLRGIREANRARDVVELRQAMMGVVTPIGAVCAADRTGAIALFATGTVPVRTHHRGTFPVPAWVRDYQWTRWAAPESVPHAIASGDAFFAHTNNLMIDPRRSDVIFQVDSAPSYRRDRAVEMLQGRTGHTAESMSEIQGDILLLRAQQLVPVICGDLEGVHFTSRTDEQAAKLLGEWDCRADAESAACAVFHEVYRECIIEAARDEVDAGGLRFLVGFRYFTNGADLWFDEARHPAWDDRATPEMETRPEVVRKAFGRAVDRLRKSYGDDPRRWRWGALHVLRAEHPFGSRLACFNLPAWEAPGSDCSVWQANFDMGSPDRPFDYLYGPVLRTVVDLGDISHAWWVVDTGTSGWPLSPHYGDQRALWKTTRLVAMVSSWQEVKEGAVAVMTLR